MIFGTSFSLFKHSLFFIWYNNNIACKFQSIINLLKYTLLLLHNSILLNTEDNEGGRKLINNNTTGVCGLDVYYGWQGCALA